jgi:methylglutaconyl-CoA hydratase
MIATALLLNGRKRFPVHSLRARSFTTAAAASDANQEPFIRLEHIHHDTLLNTFISTLTLDRPKQVNAINKEMLHQLKLAIHELSSTTSRALVVASSHPTVFCAGADLKERATLSTDETEHFVTDLRNTFQALSKANMPTIAAVAGVAAGGGLELALACDVRLACEAATLRLPETSLGIVPGAGGTQRLQRIVGAAKAKEWIFTASTITASEARAYGLVQAIVERPEQVLPAAVELAWKIAQQGPIAIAAAKRAIDDGGMAGSMEEALEIERVNYAKTLHTSDRLEGLAAFREGRTPHYQGK